MPTSDPKQDTPTAATTLTTKDRTNADDPTRTCPTCGEPIESTRQVGPVTYVLEPCGHQVDDRVLADFLSVDDPSS